VDTLTRELEASTIVGRPSRRTCNLAPSIQRLREGRPMTKQFLGKLIFGRRPEIALDGPASPRPASPANDPQSASSVDPLAQTDRYRLVVPFTPDPRRLAARGAANRPEGNASTTTTG
jgi:hypothetical protein